MKKLLLPFSLLFVGFASTAQTWNAQATGFTTASRGISEIKIVDANNVWAIAFDGTPADEPIQEFTRTTDGGNIWLPGTFSVGDPTLSITNISPVSGTTAWIGTYDATLGFGGVFKTTDGGLNWEQQNTAAYTTAGESWFNFVHFFNANVGITQGDPEGAGGEFEIYRTIDGGDNWTRVPGASLPNPLTGEYGYNGGYDVAGGTLWFTTNKGRLYRTTDMGVTWTVSQAPLADFGSAAVSGNAIFSDANNGFLLKTQGTTYTAYTTSNGGTTWTAGTPYTGAYRLLCYIPGTTTLVATGAGPTVAEMGSAFSSDNGTTWTSIDTGAQRLSPAFLNGTTGWCGGFNEDEFAGGVFKLNGTLGNSDFNTTKFKVYPNPATSVVNLQTEGLDSYTLKVTDLSGKVMTTREFSGIENALDISSYATGVYFFEINSGSQSQTIKIMKN
ncbi:T9SS type A sorting domain-containing protein [Flavobacterium terrisoli]|uniref:T9SS type A sorting domain-containing protein n=1 Tax=Flavobacterium terrisoli TaxID=3242195 RepID=UPI002542CC0E|nr:T9SS type A sorting domain-containing protein [Flavobacterium buctense]